MGTLIANGTVISPTGRIAQDVLVDGERIVALYIPGTGPRDGHRVIDATGKYVIPGGIDVHTHLDLPLGGTVVSDNFETGTIAAAWGGVTTVVDMADQHTGESVYDGLAEWHEKAAGKCAVDYSFTQMISTLDDESLKAMDYLTEHEGITSFKFFMAYPGACYSDDGQILRAMQQASHNGGLIMMHAENGIAIDVLVAQALARGETDPKYHSFTRPPELEGEATHRAIVLSKVAGNVPLYIVHMSAAEALDEVAEARHNGQNVFGETCPQYLHLTLEGTLDRPGFEGAKFVCSPPLRSKHDHRNHRADLWKGLRMNELAVVATDHCPFCFKDQKELREDPPRPRWHRAPARTDLPRCGGRRAEPRTLGGNVLHHPGAPVRAVPEEGHHCPRLGRGHRDLGSEPQDRDRRGQEAPLQHGLLGVRGHDHRRPHRHRDVTRHRARGERPVLRPARSREVPEARPLQLPRLAIRVLGLPRADKSPEVDRERRGYRYRLPQST